MGVAGDISRRQLSSLVTAPPPTPSVVSPQARSPSPAPTAAAPSPTAPTSGPTSRPTRMSRSTSARHVPEPSPECPCSTSTKSRAAQGGRADSQAPSASLGPPCSPERPPPNSRREDPASSSLPQNPLLSSAVRLHPGDHFPVLWMPCWTRRGGSASCRGGGVACRRDPSWQLLLPASMELAFLRSCSELAPLGAPACPPGTPRPPLQEVRLSMQVATPRCPAGVPPDSRSASGPQDARRPGQLFQPPVCHDGTCFTGNLTTCPKGL